MAIFILSFSVCFCLFVGTKGFDNFCNKNTFEHSAGNNEMQFTKEVNYREFAVIGNLKALHCCAQEYQTIEWYKDSKVYPWPLEVSTMLLFPASANQTIYVQSLKATDAGNYTCVLKNDSVLHTHTINLRVFDTAPDEPEITYLSENSVVSKGDPMRLYCEAFVGLVDLPDAHSEVYWYKLFPNGSKYDELPPYVKHLQTEQEDGQTLGALLMIDYMKAEDFGDYACVITKPGNTIQRILTIKEKEFEVEYRSPDPLPVAKLAILLSAIICVFVITFLLYLKFGLKFLVRCKDSFKPLEDTDGKEKDALVVYAPQDSEIALAILVPTLRGRFNYTCDSKALPSGIDTLYKNLQTETYRRLIVLISPSLVEGGWNSNSLLTALTKLRGIGPTLICISLKELPRCEIEVKNAKGDTLRALTRSLGIILWEKRDDDKFWYLVRYRLPPKRNEAKKVKPNLCSQESVEEFVV